MSFSDISFKKDGYFQYVLQDIREKLPAKMLFRTISSQHLPLYCQAHQYRSLIPAKKLQAGHC